MTRYQHRLLSRVSNPAVEPVTLTEAKLFLRVDHAADDTLITTLISAVREAAEQHVARSLITQSWKLAFDECLHECTPLPMGPVSGITSVTTFDRTGTSSLIPSASYYLNAAQDALVLDAALIAHRVEVVYVAGYGASATSVPVPIRQGMLGHLARLYDCRGEADVPLPEEVVRLYAPYREVRV